MKKVLYTALALALMVGLAVPMATSVGASSASPAWVQLETLTVDADGTVETSSTTLIDGWLYRFEASGTYSADGYDADAEYASTDSWATYTDSPSGDETLLELQVDGGTVEWGAYNAGHVYKLDYTGGGSTVDFQIYDTSYGDNSGSLSVKILATPVMVSTEITAGPATVEPFTEESWDIEITVEARYAAVTGVIVQDGMGADLDEIALSTPTQGSATTEKRGKGRMGATMVIWNVGALGDGDTETLTVTVTTGWNNPGPKKAPKPDKKEFTSEEQDHELDGGASATYWYGDPAMEYESPESEPETVDVEYD